MNEYELEKQRVLGAEAMSQGEWFRAAHDQAIAAQGAKDKEVEWILSDRDVWARNPYYSGPRGRHPEDDYPEENAPAQRQRIV